MRSLATGVEAYRVDYNKIFPTVRTTAVYQTREWIWGYMTTPVAYMTSVPEDPFNTVDQVVGNRRIVIWGPDSIDGGMTIKHRDGSSLTLGDSTARSAKWFSPYPQYSDGTDMLRNNFYVLFSLGPDGGYNILGPDKQTQNQFSAFPPMMPYDATNGTVSSGDIVRFEGGQYN
jgi:hypothetical protein